MYLDKHEEKMLSGEYGEAVRIAMEIIVRVGEALGAERLVNISHAHISGVSYFNIGDEGLEFLSDLISKGARASIYTTANPSSIAILDPFTNIYNRDIVVKQYKIIKLLKSLGIDDKSFTCIPYKIRRPKINEHLAWAESSAVIYANSVVGAKTNREGGIVALMAAIIGKTYYSGMHIDENRLPTEIIKIDFPIGSIFEASIIGLHIGSITKGIPYIEMNMSVEDYVYRDIIIRNLLASIASTSDSPMAIIEGITPKLNKVTIKERLERITIDSVEIKRFSENICSNTLFIGCPHITVEELRHISDKIFLGAKSLGIEKIFVALPQNSEDTTSIAEEFRKRGIEIVFLRGACPVVSNLKELNLHSLSTPHGKAFHYIPKLGGIKACLVNAV